MPEHKAANKKEVTDFFSQMNTGIITDAMTILGLEGSTRGIFPMNPEDKVFGKAFTIHCAPVRRAEEPNYSMYDLYDKWEQDDVIVVGGQKSEYSLLGENVASVCMEWGACGVVLSGRCRDYNSIKKLSLPVFCMGPTVKLRPKYQRFVSYGHPIICSGAQVFPGDYVLGDADGVVFFPNDKLHEIMRLCAQISKIEQQIQKAIHSKAPMEEIKALVNGKKELR